MNFKNSVFIILVLCLSTVGFAQRGKDGARTVSTTNVIYNEYTTLTANATAGNTTIQVAASSLNANNRFGYSLAPGDLIMIIQMQGATIDGNGYWPNWGFVNNYNTCGNNEFAQVKSLPNGTSIELSCPLQKNYTSAGRVQVVRIPRLTTLTVNANDTLTCEPWNGSYGGILAIEATGTTLMNAGGIVSATGKGFRGGVNSDMNSTTGVITYASTNNNDGAEKGEGVAGYQADYDTYGGRYGKNAGGNAGGGGNAHNGGGGGGANGSFYYNWNGKGNPDTSVVTWKQAWDLEGGNFHKNVSDGGGRGGYTYSWNDLDALTVAPNDPLWGGDLRRNEGGQGGRPLDYNFDRLYLAGGGGAGDQGPGTNYGGNGGRGGGLIYMLCYGNISGTGQFVSNGKPGGDAQGTPPVLPPGHAGIDGAGGGGGGGTVILNSAGVIANTISVIAKGGKGGDQLKTKALGATNNGEAEGPGGGGGGGHISICGGNPVRQADGGVNGTSTAQTNGDNGVVEFAPNGATKGGPGMTYSFFSTFTLTASNDTVCQGQTAVLTANLTGSVPGGTTIYWYDSEVGGNIVGTGPTLTLTNTLINVQYYAGTCPGVYRVPALAYVYPFAYNAGNDIHLCNANSDTLHATGGTSYSWSPAGFLNNPTSPDPIATVSNTTEFFVTIQNAYGCVGVDSVTVFINNVNASISNDTAVCTGHNIVLTAGGGQHYQWSTTDTTASINLVPPGSQNYFVTVSTGSCMDTASVHVTVNSLPVVDIGNDTSICQGAALLLDAGNPGASYHWQNNSTNQTFSASTGGTYAVTVTNANGCSAVSSLLLTVTSWADATITNVSPVCINTPAFNLTAAQSGGTWSGTGITSTTLGTFNPALAGAGQHIITYVIGGQCGDTDQDTVYVNPLPLVNIGNDTAFCQGDSLVMNAGNAGSTYLWQDNSTGQTYTANATGLYSVTVTTAGCSASASLQLTVNNWADATITLVQPVCSNVPPFNLVAAQSGGIWSGTGITNPTAGTFSPAVSGVGQFVVTYTIGGLCGDSDQETVTVNPNPAMSAVVTEVSCPDLNNGSIDLTVTTGAAPFTFAWSNSASTEDITQLIAGSYTVTVTDANNCSATFTEEIPPVIADCFTPHIYLPNIFSPNGDGINDVLKVRGMGITTLTFFIYNRWGEKIFETEVPDSGWDGKFHGKDMETDAYAYYLKYELSSGEKGVLKGTITLVR